VFDAAHKKSADSARHDTEWPAFARVFLLTFGAGLALLYVFILLVDPFGTGWFPALPMTGINDEDPRTADVYRARDPQFDSAIIGNSTGQLLSPERLNRANGPNFVQLTIPGSGPREQLAVWRWFATHHNAVNAIVLIADPSWCTDDAGLPLLHPFPFWLYSDRWFDYGINIFSMRSLDRAVRRLKLVVGLQKPSDPSGYSDYELGRIPSFSPEVRNLAAPEASPAPEFDFNQSFPAIDGLDHAIAALASTAAVIIVAPPVFFTALPKAGTQQAVRADACKRRLAEAVDGRRHSGFVDMFRDTSLTHNSANFMDDAHYRATVAKLIEARIAAILAGEKSRHSPDTP
jgi:hypothetical protein